MTTEIRQLGPGDEALAFRLMETFYPARQASFGGGPTFTSGRHLIGLLADKRTFLLAAYVDRLPVGLAVLHELPRLDGPQPKMLLYSLDVVETHRRQGFGKALVAASMRVARERKCRSLWLVTNEANTPAINLYQTMGGERPAGDDVVVTWELGG